MTDRSPERLSPEEIAALRRAGQNQLVRWRRHGLDADLQARPEHLRRALHKLKALKGGCEVRLDPSERPWRHASGHGADS